jgi:ring-1,2-phenylacetyl-CoA epoxidase subunit PaaC
MKDQLTKYLMMLGDNAMILGHRLSELCGHGPTLETDIALTNISLDLYGQVRSYFQYAAELSGEGVTEDTIAFLRKERTYLNVVLLEQPNENFAHVIVRQFLYDMFQSFLTPALMRSTDERIAAIAAKSIKETKYHLRFSTQWMKRLGAGTEESNSKIQAAVNHLLPFTDELFVMTAVEKEMLEQGIGPDLQSFKEDYYIKVQEVLTQAELSLPEAAPRVVKGKTGIHSEHMGYILNELQYMQRAYPQMEW